MVKEQGWERSGTQQFLGQWERVANFSYSHYSFKPEIIGRYYLISHMIGIA